MKTPHEMVIDRLVRRFPEIPEATVIGTVTSIEASLDDARIRDYVPLLVEREARDFLAHLPPETAQSRESA